MIDSVDSGEQTTADPLVDRAVRLFTFLGQAQQLRTPRVHDLDSYTRDGAIHWLHAVPDHPAISVSLAGAPADPTAPVLTADRVPRVDPPVPSGALRAWLDGSFDDARDEPGLRSKRYLPSPDPEDEGTRLAIADHPEIREAHERYLRLWRPWAEAERLDEVARAFYGELFSTFVTATGHPEELELVLGTGLLAWQPSDHAPVRRHLVTTALTISFDDDSGRLSVGVAESGGPVRLELDMLDPGLVTNAALVNAIREDVTTSDHHPLNRDRVGEFTRRLIHSLSADAEYHDENQPAPVSARPMAAHAPAILLRKRTQQGTVEIFRTITEQIAGSGAVPQGLRTLVDPDRVPAIRAEGERTDGAVVRVDDEPFLPLPVNDVQLRILQRVDTNAQTLIQGPPGTGKTHTAAVLISHLLAQGKRVLVTAHTDRALREVRAKLPEPIKPLAVSVVGAGREDMSDLRVAVERIAAAAGEHDTGEARQSIDHHLGAVDHLRRRRAELHNLVLDARRHEIDEHEFAGYCGTLAGIARRRAAEAARHEWILDLLGDPAGPPPLSDDDIAAWRARLLDDDLRSDEAAAGRRLVGIEALPDAGTFVRLITAEARADEASARYARLREHPAYAAVRRLPAPERDALAERLSGLRNELHTLGQRREPWLREALRDVLTGRAGSWTARRTAMQHMLEDAEATLRTLGSVTDVRCHGDVAGLEHHARALHEHLATGNALKLGRDGLPKIGAFTPRPVKQAATVFERVRVNGSVPVTADGVSAFLTWLHGTLVLAALDRAWPSSVTVPAEDTLHERFEWHRTEIGLLDRLLRLAAELAHEEQRLDSLRVPRPHWPDAQDVAAVSTLPQAAHTDDAAQQAHSALNALTETLEAEQRWPDAEETIAHLLDATRRRDQGAYAGAFGRIARLHRVRSEVAARDEAGRRLAAAAPGIAAAVESAPADPGWDDRLTSFTASWNWALAGAWLAGRTAPDVNARQREITEIDDRTRGHVQELAAIRAWNHAVGPERLTPGSRASLEQYAALVRRFGKTGGQYRAQRQAEIRDAMDRCRPAVPVWIMPLYRIAEQLRIAPDMFDVVIVDEASQAGLEASFLQYLAPRIVVIGDDKQVSPAAVGVDQQQLRDLGNQYLYDDPYRATWQDPQRSLFDEARMRFSGMLTLVEHRRCVPEIINFSNRIAYEPDNVRLIPVRQFGADRLEPIKPVFVEDGYEKGGSTTKVNPPEVDAIVDRIEKCIADPRYDGLSFGVISLLGTAQAKAIEKALLERVSPEDWSARDLRCGDAADFQGSERDVMFLSMVAVPAEDRRLAALTANQYVQRYNVAASRAKDQMWVFHSVRRDQLTNSEDMRFQLLDYCYGVQRRGEVDDDRAVTTLIPEDRVVTPFGSLFEQRVCNRLHDHGYTVVPQFPALGYAIDLVVTGPSARLAIECDGDFWHGPDAYQRDMARQRELERCGWTFVRVLESEFYRDPAAALAPVWERLAELDIHPFGTANDSAAGAPETGGAPSHDGDSGLDDEPDTAGDVEQPSADTPSADSIDVEQGDTSATPRGGLHEQAAPTVGFSLDPAAPPVEDEEDPEPEPAAAGNGLAPYREYLGALPPVDTASQVQIADGLVAIVEAEGPVLGSRLHSAYVQASGGLRVGSQIAQTLNRAIALAIRQGRLVKDNPLRESGNKPCTFRVAGQPEALPRARGPRSLEQVPPAELAEVMRSVAEEIGWEDVHAVYRATVGRYGMSRVRSTTRDRLVDIERFAVRADR